MWHQIVDFLSNHPGELCFTVLPAAGAGVVLACAKLFMARYDPSDPYSRKPRCRHDWHCERSVLGASTERNYFGEFIKMHRICRRCNQVEVLPNEDGVWIDPVELKNRNACKSELTAATHRRLKELCDGTKPAETSNDRVYLTRRGMWACRFGNIPFFRRANGESVVICRFDNGKVGDPVGDDIAA